VRGVEERPDGLRYRPDLLSPPEDAALVAAFERYPFDEVRMRGQAARRTVRHFGFTYGVFALTLDPGSAYVLSGAARTTWQHSIPAVPALRYSVTFRTLRARNGITR
jgi:hypothetical protein